MRRRIAQLSVFGLLMSVMALGALPAGAYSPDPPSICVNSTTFQMNMTAFGEPSGGEGPIFTEMRVYVNADAATGSEAVSADNTEVFSFTIDLTTVATEPNRSPATAVSIDGYGTAPDRWDPNALSPSADASLSPDGVLLHVFAVAQLGTEPFPVGGSVAQVYVEVVESDGTETFIPSSFTDVNVGLCNGAGANLEADASAPATATTAGTTTVTVSAMNLGPLEAPDVEVRGTLQREGVSDTASGWAIDQTTLPTDCSYVAQAVNNGMPNNPTVSCSAGALAAGDTVSFSFGVTFSEAGAYRVWSGNYYPQTASLADEDLSNNFTFTTATEVTASGTDADVTIDDVSPEFEDGSETFAFVDLPAEFAVTIANNGSASADAVELTVAPTNATGQTVSLGSMPAGGSTTATIAVTWASGASETVTFDVSTTTTESDTSNNQAIASVEVVDPDGHADGDGIANSIDGTLNGSFTWQPFTDSSMFSDEYWSGTTFGTVDVDNGLTITDSDAAADGVDISTTGDSTLVLCEDATSTLFTASTSATVTCGSVTITVHTGSAVLTVGDSTVEVTGGSTVEVDEENDETTIDVQSGTATVTDGTTGTTVSLGQGETLSNPTADDDGDGLTNLEEALTGTDPDEPDSDEDGIGDSADPTWLAVAVDAYPRNSFSSKGHQKAMGSILEDAEMYVGIEEYEEALALLDVLDKKSAGCGSEADHNDWITDCATQVDFRTLLELLRDGIESA